MNADPFHPSPLQTPNEKHMDESDTGTTLGKANQDADMEIPWPRQLPDTSRGERFVVPCGPCEHRHSHAGTSAELVVWLTLVCVVRWCVF